MKIRQGTATTTTLSATWDAGVSMTDLKFNDNKYVDYIMGVVIGIAIALWIINTYLRH